MPDITAAAPLDYAGGTLRTSRIAPARLRYTAGSFLTSSESPVSTAVDIPALNRLYSAEQLTNPSGTPTRRLMALWQEAMTQIEQAFAAVNARVDEVALFARLNAVESLAQAANDNATAAVAQVETVSQAVSETFTEIDPVYGGNFSDRLEP